MNESEPYVPPLILFTGAGASRANPLDFPTTTEFKQVLEERSTGVEKGILSYITGVAKAQDIEEILVPLDSLIRLEQNEVQSLLANSAVTMGQVGGWQNILGSAKRLRELIYDLLFDQYGFHPRRGSDAASLYTPLFEALMELSPQALYVFTTNYDRVIEEFADTSEGRRFEFIDGFVPQGVSLARKVWDEAALLRTGKDKPTLKLFKLHGSLTWGKTVSGHVVSFGVEQRLRSGEFSENILVYPGTKNPPQTEPFKTLHKWLSSALLRVRACLVVGFSFRDDYINSLFLTALERNPELQVVVVSPTAPEKALKNLFGGERSRHKGRVIPVIARFGEPGMIAAVRSSIAKGFSSDTEPKR